jgi:hypothetical protein
MGTYHRRIEIRTQTTGPGRSEARCALEDDFHHFRVVVEFEKNQVAEIGSEGFRVPNTLCPSAGHRLRELIGMPLNEASAAVFAVTDQHQQCTHQFDMAGLAIAVMAQKCSHRHYEIAVPDRVEGHTVATVRCDSNEMLRWDVVEMTIQGPAPFTGQSLGAGFTRFTRDLPLRIAEAALVLRRGLFVSQGRRINIDALGRNGPVGGCWAWQPERMEELERLPSSRRDFTGHAGLLTIEDQAWLRFDGGADM